VDHPDSPCLHDLTHPDSNCVGRSFLRSDGDGGDEQDRWHDPLLTHGTHVAGTVSTAGRLIAGMIPSSGACFIIAQVFGTAGSSSMSVVIEATEWAISIGASVVNLSLGGDQPSQTAETYFSEVRNDGVIVVAAAGNKGTTAYSYPGSYPWVVSVAAVDDQSLKPWFSQTNDQVDIAAPGVSILSTVPTEVVTSRPNISALEYGDQVLIGIYAARSPKPSPPDSLTARLKACPDAGTVPCDARGYICLIER